jgi:hypothetical protein
MKNTLYHLILITACCMVFTRCRSVDITLLGYFTKKYGDGSSHQKAVPNEIEKQPEALAGISITGSITSGSNQPVKDADVYMIQGNTILFHTKSDQKGMYLINNIQPSTYTLYLSPPGTDTTLSRELDVRAGTKMPPVNFSF